MSKPQKPLGRKAYGSIPHLPTSRLGPGDHQIHEGQDVICCDRARDKHDRIIITEKLDGGNVAVAKINNIIIPLGRAGYRAETSPFEQHHRFARWVAQHDSLFRALLSDGECVNGEWLAQAHGTRYELPHAPFVAFDMKDPKGIRLPWDETRERADKSGLILPRILSDGPPQSVADVLPLLEISGHGAIDPVEGAVWRVERRGVFDFMAKWVRPDKQDGKYLPEISGDEPIWHWDG